jgi:hypothetical protein
MGRSSSTANRTKRQETMRKKTRAHFVCCYASPSKMPPKGLKDESIRIVNSHTMAKDGIATKTERSVSAEVATTKEKAAKALMLVQRS